MKLYFSVSDYEKLVIRASFLKDRCFNTDSVTKESFSGMRNDLNGVAALIPALKSDINDSKREGDGTVHDRKQLLLRTLEKDCKDSLSLLRSSVVKVLKIQSPKDLIVFILKYGANNTNTPYDVFMKNSVKDGANTALKILSKRVGLDISPTPFDEGEKLRDKKASFEWVLKNEFKMTEGEIMEALAARSVVVEFDGHA
ncbi:ORF9 [Cnidium closterovirus 1]|nr:ORF9 [Cnidium closterovirus 1]